MIVARQGSGHTSQSVCVGASSSHTHQSIPAFPHAERAVNGNALPLPPRGYGRPFGRSLLTACRSTLRRAHNKSPAYSCQPASSSDSVCANLERTHPGGRGAHVRQSSSVVHDALHAGTRASLADALSPTRPWACAAGPSTTPIGLGIRSALQPQPTHRLQAHPSTGLRSRARRTRASPPSPQTARAWGHAPATPTPGRETHLGPP